MFNSVINIATIILIVIWIAVDIKKIKAIRENTKVYKDLEKEAVKIHTDINIAIKNQEANSISIEELTDEVLKRLTNVNRDRNG